MVYLTYPTTGHVHNYCCTTEALQIKGTARSPISLRNLMHKLMRFLSEIGDYA